MNPQETAPTPMDPAMQEPVEVRAVKTFGLGDTLIEVGGLVQVSRARAAYLKFLGLAEPA